MKPKTIIVLTFVTLFILIGNLFANVVYTDVIWFKVIMFVLFVANFSWLIRENRKNLKSKVAAYGLNMTVTILLVVGILGVLNFLASRYPQKIDLTQNKIHTLSDQTKKVIQNLKHNVKATLFEKMAQREKFRPLLDNLKGLNPKFEIEYVDPDRDPVRVKQAGVKKYGTLQLAISEPSSREAKVEDVTEEKVTNALIKLLKEKPSVLCPVSGHGERSFGGNTAEDYETIKKSLENQSNEVKEILLQQQSKVPDECTAIAIIGPTKAFFDQEIRLIKDYLANGGRAVIAYDLNLNGKEYSPQLVALLKEWQIAFPSALVVDPESKIPSISIMDSFSRDHVITRDFNTAALFPMMRPLDILPNTPASLNVQWLSKTGMKAFGVVDLNSLKKGAIAFQPHKDLRGPLTGAIAIEGKLKDSKAKESTRLVIFGTSQFATNNYSRFGGNSDLFLNSVSWLLDDENLISIRSKDEGPGRVELTAKTGNVVFLISVIVIPILISVFGIVVWLIRRRL